MTTVAALSKLDPPTPRRLLRGLYDEFANWYLVGPLSWVALPSRCPPRHGLATLAHKRIRVKMRGGDRAECRVDEFFSFVEVFVLREYDRLPLDWATARTIVDVGANVGAATLWFARRAPQATIVAVEPSRPVASALTRNVQANGLGPRVRVVAAALAARTGTVELQQRGSSVFRAFARESSIGGERVPAVSLEDLLDEHDLEEVDVLKLDCEGAEFEVLLSADSDVLRRIRFIIGEYHSAGQADLACLLAGLEDAGFRTSSSGTVLLGNFQAVRT